MSSGVTGNAGVLSAGFVGSDTYRVWAGDDGKYQATPTGKVRSKWNNYSLRRAFRTRSGDIIRYYLNDGTSFDLHYGPSDFYVFPWPAIYDRIDVTAQSRLVDAVKGHNFNLAVNVAQSRQLVDMVVSNLGKFGRAMLALKRGDFATAARQLGASARPSRLKPSDVAGRWLELMYGWLPALSDTYEAAKAYEVITSKERITTVYASAKTVVIGQASRDASFSCKERWVQRVGYRYELSEVMSASRSLGLQDPLSVAWELIPYSFVVDWFVPIGTYLDNLAILPHLKGRWMKTVSTVTSEFGPDTYVGPLPVPYQGKQIIRVEIRYNDSKRGLMAQRFVGTDAIPVAFPSFDTSGFRGRRIWNAVALAYQRFGR